MATDRRQFLTAALAASALYGAAGFGNWAGLAAQQRLTQDNLLSFEPPGNVTLIHLTDLDAQRRPVSFREPDTNLGVGPDAAQPLGLGRPALPEGIAARVVAVLADGTGLREGRGNVLDGEELWVDMCAACHGDFGEGAGAWPVIAGGMGLLTRDRPVKTVGSDWPFLGTVRDCVHRSMPSGQAQAPGVDNTCAIVAYILHATGLVGDDLELSDENFLVVRLPNAVGFYEDHRDALEVPRFAGQPWMTDGGPAPVVTFRATKLDVTPLDLPAALAGRGDAAAGTDPARVAAGDVACRKVGAGARNGIIGRAAGTGEGFRCSPPMVAAGQGGMIWTAETLDAFLADPGKPIPRNRMSFRGIGDAGERGGLIAYVATFTD